MEIVPIFVAVWVYVSLYVFYCFENCHKVRQLIAEHGWLWLTLRQKLPRCRRSVLVVFKFQLTRINLDMQKVDRELRDELAST